MARAGWRLDAAVAFAVGGTGAAQLLAAKSNGNGPQAGLAVALAVGCVAIPVRRRYPLAAAVVAGAVWFVPGVVIGHRWSDASPAVFAFAFTLFAYTLGSREQDTRGLLGLVAVIIGSSGGDFADPVTMFVFTVPAWVAGAVVQSRSRLTVQLAERARELDDEREAFAREAVAFERVRIAREMHDIVAHNISMMVVQAGAGQRQLASDPARAAEAFDHIKAAADLTELELGRLLELLGGDSPNHTVDGLGLIDELVRRAAATGIPATCRLSGAHDALPVNLGATAYRIAQEGLTNAVKHAPGAPVEIIIDAGADTVTITVQNGPPPSGASELEGTGGQHGISGMRERVHDDGGTLRAGPAADGGWNLTARLPRRATTQA